MVAANESRALNIRACRIMILLMRAARRSVARALNSEHPSGGGRRGYSRRNFENVVGAKGAAVLCRPWIRSLMRS